MLAGLGSAACRPLTICSPEHLSMPMLQARPVVPLQVGVIGCRTEPVLITPTCVGKTKTHATAMAARPVHPHVRGDGGG